MTRAADPSAAALLMRLDPMVWFESRGVIRLTSGKMSKPGELRANVLQRRIFALRAARRKKGKPCFCIGLKPRKRGFSTAVAALHYTTMAGQSLEGVIVGNKLETSDTVYRMLGVFAEHDELARRGEWSSPAKAQAEKMSWQHGSVVGQSTAHGRDSIRGQTPQFVHGTEVAHWEQEDDVFLALMNAVPDDPNVAVFLESTPKGRGGAFNVRWSQARWPRADECPDGDTYWQQWAAKCPDQPDAMFADWEFVRVFAAWFEFDEAALQIDDEQRRHIEATLDSKSWYYGEKALIEAYANAHPETGVQRLGREVNGVDIWQQLAWRRMTIQTKCGSDPGKFDQEYPKDPHTCFLSSGRPVFDSDAIEHYGAQVIAPEFGTLESNCTGRADKTHERVVWRRVHPDDAVFWRWEQPRMGCLYLIVIDTAEGSDQSGGRDPDRHSVLVLRRAYTAADGTQHRARLVARVRPPCYVPMHVLVEWAHLLHLHYHALVIPEMNRSGLAYIMGARMRGTPLWKRKEWNPRDGRSEEKFGWRTTDNSDYGGVRTLILDTLGRVLREREIDLHDAHVVHELGCFVDKGGRKEAETGEHDDDVLALAIGVANLDAATGYAEPLVERQMPADLRAMLEEGSDRKGGAHFW